MANPLDQLAAISAVGFKTVPLLNRDEARLLPIVERAVRKHGDGHRVMAQTSLGELIRPAGANGDTPAGRDAYASINSKRLDLAIINRFGHLVAAIEYQGSGHHQGNAFLRDAVKREAVRRAGVPYLEIAETFDPDEVARRVRDAIAPADTAPGARNGSASILPLPKTRAAPPE